MAYTRFIRRVNSGQNGTLTLYPGESFGQTWLADGATITLDRGIIKGSKYGG